MSLFPAYSGQDVPDSDPTPTQPALEDLSEKKPKDWIQLSSYDSKEFEKQQRERKKSPSHSKKRKKRSRSRSRERRRRRSRSRSRSRDRRSRSRSRSRSRKHKKDDKSKRKLTREELIVKHSANKQYLDEVGVRPEAAFREDRQGDAKLTKSSQLPSRDGGHIYKVYAKGPALGSSEKKQRSKKRNELRFYHKQFFQAFISETGLLQLRKLIDTEEGRDKILIQHDHVDQATPLDPSSNPLGIFDQSTATYLTGTGGLTTPESEAEPESYKLDQIRQRTKELNQRIASSPHDVDLWLDFVDFQNISLEDSEFGDGASDKKSKKKKGAKNVVLKQNALLEKKFAVLDKAMELNPREVRLHLKRLDLSRQILDKEALNSRWEDLVFNLFRDDSDLFHHYLRFVTSYFTSFSVTNVIRAYKLCFSKLKIANESFQRRRDDLEDVMRVHLNNLCHFFARSGFREKAMSIFQAMIELNMFSPEFPGSCSNEDRLNVFDSFWECGAPRFGETGAKGWAKVRESVQDAKPGACGLDTDQIEDQLLTAAGELVAKNRLWLEIESLREKSHFLPWRSSEEEADDPARMVPYDEISPFLFHFKDPIQYLRTLLNFVDLLGVGFHDELFLPTCLSSETMNNRLGLASAETLSTESDHSNNFDFPFLQKTTPDILQNQEYQTFCRNVFSHARLAMAEPFRTQIIQLWLRFEVYILENANFEESNTSKKGKSKELKALVKGLLQDDQQNIDIYLEYARLEYKLTGFKQAWKIIDTTIQASPSKLDDRIYTCAQFLLLSELYRTECREQTLMNQLLAVLSSGAQGQGDWLSGDQDRMQMLGQIEVVKVKVQNDVMSCLQKDDLTLSDDKTLAKKPVSFISGLQAKIQFSAWLLFITEGPAEADKFLRVVSDKLQAKSSSDMLQIVQENVHKLTIEVWLLESQRNRLAIKKAKEVVGSAITLFPGNLFFLQCMKLTGVQPNIMDPVWRQLSQKSVSKEATVMCQVQAVNLLVQNYVRFRDDDSFSGSVASLYRAQALLEEFVSKEPGRYCPILWRLLMWVANMLGTHHPEENKRIQDVNTVYYRSLQDCPSVKALYLDAVKYLHLDDESDEELKRKLDTFKEKEGRIRLLLPELDILLEKEEDEEDMEED